MTSGNRFTAITIAATLVVSQAHADVSEVATARQLAISGIDAVESGDCQGGAPLLERAEALHHASVHLQYLARCRARSGRLVAATEMWRQIVREGAPPAASPAVLAALNEATTELEAALPRLASTSVRTAAEYKALELRLDGAPLPAEIVGTSQVLDPGAHELSARAPGFGAWSRRWTLGEGGTAEIVIELTPVPHGTEPGPARDPVSRDGSRKTSVLAPVGWVTASAGLAALVGGTVTLLTANSRRDALAASCTRINVADPSQPLCWQQGDRGAPSTAHVYTPGELESDKQTVRDLTTATNALFIGGGILVAGGVTLVVIGTASGRGKEPEIALSSGVPGSPTGLTLRGRW